MIPISPYWPLVIWKGFRLPQTPLRDKHLCIYREGQTFLQIRGKQTIFTIGGGQTFFHQGGEGQTFYTREGLGQTFYVGNGGDVADVNGEEDVSEANILLSEANILLSEGSMLSAGARIFRGCRALKF